MINSPENLFSHSKDDFELKKRRFFSKIAMQERDFLCMHRSFGLLEGDSNREWGNVSEHCLVAVARVDVLSEQLKLSDETRALLRHAAALHDFFKKREKDATDSSGKLNWKSYADAGDLANAHMREAGISEDIIKLVNAVAHTSLYDAEAVLRKETLAENEIAFLVMHYVDDYTRGSGWASPQECLPDGAQINDLDRRLFAAEANPRYAQINQDGIGRFMEGETSYQAQRRIGHEVEQRLANLISKNVGKSVNAVALPIFIDGEIKSKINSFLF